jgi:hypothetical protein
MTKGITTRSVFAERGFLDGGLVRALRTENRARRGAAEFY